MNTCINCKRPIPKNLIRCAICNITSGWGKNAPKYLQKSAQDALKANDELASVVNEYKSLTAKGKFPALRADRKKIISVGKKLNKKDRKNYNAQQKFKSQLAKWEKNKLNQRNLDRNK